MNNQQKLYTKITNNQYIQTQPQLAM